MKRLLILAYDFPPYVSVGGLRPFAWYKYLKEFGVEPVVVTRQWGNVYGNELDYIAPGSSNETLVEETECGTIIRTPYKPNLANRLMLRYGKNHFALVRKAVTAFYEFAQYLFFVGPKSCVYRGAKNYLKNNKVDAIIATGEPFVLFKYASALSRKHNIPWIADYRDPWTENRNRNKWFGRLSKHYERLFTANAECAITVDDFFRMQIGTNVSKPFHIIPNGYNPDAINAVSEISQGTDCLRFAFVGTIYKWHPLESVLRGFSLFADAATKPEFELNFFGINNADELNSLLTGKFPNLIGKVQVIPRMDNSLLMQKLAKHNIMLLFNYYSFTGTKIYDYLGLKRKILLCYSDDNEARQLKEKYYPTEEIAGLSTHLQEDLINATHSGVVVKDKDHLMSVLADLYNEFSATGSIACGTVGEEKYSRKGGAEMLADIVLSL